MEKHKFRKHVFSANKLPFIILSTKLTKVTVVAVRSTFPNFNFLSGDDEDMFHGCSSLVELNFLRGFLYCTHYSLIYHISCFYHYMLMFIQNNPLIYPAITLYIYCRKKINKIIIF